MDVVKPRIAITADAARTDKPEYLRSYRRAVEQAGGEPELLTATGSDLEATLQNFDGLLLPGGADVDPAAYGGRDHPTVYKAPSALDELELAAARWAKRLDLPTLAICRGAQVMNVALGGTLWEDIPDQYEPQGSKLQHQQTPEHSRQDPTHPVDFQSGTRLHDLFGSLTVLTNSMHHQALRRIAHDLVPAGKTRDGIVEAVEARDNLSFYVGVQWHPEDMIDRDEPSRALFRELVAQASLRARRRAALPS